jgi:hypothetical protein
MHESERHDDERAPVEGRCAGIKGTLLWDLERFGPRFTTMMRVNGRLLSLDATIRLVEQLPEDAYLRRRGGEMTITPDPFRRPRSATDSPAESRELVERLIARQDETDRRSRPWWRRWLGR